MHQKRRFRDPSSFSTRLREWELETQSSPPFIEPVPTAREGRHNLDGSPFHHKVRKWRNLELPTPNYTSLHHQVLFYKLLLLIAATLRRHFLRYFTKQQQICFYASGFWSYSSTQQARSQPHLPSIRVLYKQVVSDIKLCSSPSRDSFNVQVQLPTNSFSVWPS